MFELWRTLLCRPEVAAQSHSPTVNVGNLRLPVRDLMSVVQQRVSAQRSTPSHPSIPAPGSDTIRFLVRIPGAALARKSTPGCAPGTSPESTPGSTQGTSPRPTLKPLPKLAPRPTPGVCKSAPTASPLLTTVCTDSESPASRTSPDSSEGKQRNQTAEVSSLPTEFRAVLHWQGLITSSRIMLSLFVDQRG